MNPCVQYSPLLRLNLAVKLTCKFGKRKCKFKKKTKTKNR